jgi:hypothetical protein
MLFLLCLVSKHGACDEMRVCLLMPVDMVMYSIICTLAIVSSLYLHTHYIGEDHDQTVIQKEQRDR